MPYTSEVKTIKVQYENGVAAENVKVSLFNRDGCFGDEFTDEFGEVEFDVGGLADSFFTVYVDGDEEFSGYIDEMEVITIEGEGAGSIDVETDSEGRTEIFVQVNKNGQPVQNARVAIGTQEGIQDEGCTNSYGNVILNVLANAVGGECTVYIDGQEYTEDLIPGIEIDIGEGVQEDEEDEDGEEDDEY